jgi:hypothetical protein
MYAMNLTVSKFALLRATSASLILVTLTSLSFGAEKGSPDPDCSSIEDDAARLACYDGSSVPPSPEAAPPTPVEIAVVLPAVEKAPVTNSAPVVEPETLDDAVGRETVKGREGEDMVLVQGHVASCREDVAGKFRFYFDNGQIWQQRDNKPIRWKTCEFDVTIEKDFFGYKMLPDGEKRTIRISRIQ